MFIDDGYYENLRGRVLKSADRPKFYVVGIPDRGSVVRNRKFLKPCTKSSVDHFVEISTEQNDNAKNNRDEASSYVTRSGRVSKPPQRLNYDKFKMRICLLQLYILSFAVKGDVVERTNCVYYVHFCTTSGLNVCCALFAFELTTNTRAIRE